MILGPGSGSIGSGTKIRRKSGYFHVRSSYGDRIHAKFDILLFLIAILNLFLANLNFLGGIDLEIPGNFLTESLFRSVIL